MMKIKYIDKHLFNAPSNNAIQKKHSKYVCKIGKIKELRYILGKILEQYV